jgi:CelD/BcsL family acetyltransferase involved in cellulose biosynthesis
MMLTVAAAGLDQRSECSAPELHVEIVTGYQSFLELEPEWNELVETAAPAHPFLEHAWIRTWWECFGEASRLQVLVIKAGSRPIAIAPLILTTVRMWGLTLRRLGFFYNAHVPRADFLIAERHEEVYRAIWSHLSKNLCWDLLQLCQLQEGSRTLETVSRLAAADGCPSGTWGSGASPYIPLDVSCNRYFDSLAAKHRANLRNRFKRLRSAAAVDVETVTSCDGLEDALRLEAAAWKGENGTAISSHPAVSRFYALLAERAAERGWLGLHFLRAGSARIAFDYSLIYRNRIHLMKLGYDPVYAAYSPSNLLLHGVLESAFQQGAAEYDFLGEEAPWKQCWASQTRSNYWLFVFSNSFKGRLLHRIKFQLVPLLKRLRNG